MKTVFSAYWRETASGKRSNILSKLFVMLLIPASILYGLIQKLRFSLYKNGIIARKRLPRPVISVGNITVGGTGKTPIALHIAKLLLQRGVRVAVLSRGYGGKMEGETAIVSDGSSIMLNAGQCGDEPFLLASKLPGLMVVIGADRYSAGVMAMEQLFPDIFLLDDGFQHLRLHRDLDILLLDGNAPFGNGWTMPSGLLREPVAAVNRSNMIIYTRCPHGFEPEGIISNKPVCASSHRLVDARPLLKEQSLSFASLQNMKFMAFAGIAEPQVFFDELADNGLNVVATMPFPDHAEYGELQISAIVSAMNKFGADTLITTEKDGVKLNSLPPILQERTLLARLDLTFINHFLLSDSILNLLQK